MTTVANKQKVILPLRVAEAVDPCSGRKNNLDGGYGWVIVFAAFASQFLVGGILWSFGIFFVDVSKEFSSAGKSSISFIASILIALTGIIGPIASVLVNKLGCRIVSLLGSLIAAFGFGFSYFVHTVTFLYVTIGIAGGIGLGFMYLPSLVIVHQYFSKRRSTAVGICVCGSGLGTFFFQWIFGIILAEFSWRIGFAIQSGTILFLGILIGLLYRPIQIQPQLCVPEASTSDAQGARRIANDDTKGHNIIDALPNQHTEKGRSKICWDLIDLGLLKNPLFIAYTFCDILGSFGYNVSYIYLPEMEEKFLETGGNSVLLGIVGITNVSSRLLSGYLSDKPWVNRLYLYNGAVLVIGAGMILSPHLESLTELESYAAVFGLSIGVLNSLKTVVLIDLVGFENFTDAFGLSLFISSVAAIFGPPIVGLLHDIGGSYKYGFYCTGSSVVLSGVTMLILVPIIKRLQRNKSKYMEKLRKFEIGQSSGFRAPTAV